MGSRNKFIKVFVNEMYAILLGIGIGNILFGSDFNIKDIHSVISLLFVTSVILVYWWDWTEYIEDAVLNSKREIVIDFLILIALEMLFAFYLSPINLGYIFTGLAILDLIWVLNQIYESNKQEFDNIKRIKLLKWILEKSIGIALYVLLVFVIITTEKYADESVSKYITLIELIIAFSMVRKLSFNQVKKMNIAKVELAHLDDLYGVIEINHSYFQDKKRGLLLKKYTVSELVELIQDQKIYLALTSDDLVIGYIILCNEVDPEVISKTEATNNELIEHIFDEEYLYIEQIAIKLDCRRSGIASKLLDYVSTINSKKNLLAFVAAEPINNNVSLEFHMKNGFKKIGVFSQVAFFGRENYKSYLLLKEHKNEPS